MTSLFQAEASGYRENEARFFDTDISIEHIAGTQNTQRTNIDLILEIQKLSESEGYGKTTADRIAAGALQFTVNGGDSWEALNPSETIRANELHSFSVPVVVGNSVNFRYMSEADDTAVYLKRAIAHYNIEPIS